MKKLSSTSIIIPLCKTVVEVDDDFDDGVVNDDGWRFSSSLLWKWNPNMALF